MSHEMAKPSPVAGAILLSATLLEVLGMAHHPSVHSPDVGVAIEQISQLGRLSGWVHGIILAAMLCIAYGLLEYVAWRGWARPWIRAGSIAYATGVLVMFGAGLVSGFILPGLVALTPHANPVDLAINAQLLLLCRVLNQSCANVSTIATCAGIFCWSIDLWRERGALYLLSLLGMVVSILPALALIGGWLRLDVRGMSEVVWLWALWNGGVALVLMRPVNRRGLSAAAAPKSGDRCAAS